MKDMITTDNFHKRKLNIRNIPLKFTVNQHHCSAAGTNAFSL